MDSLGVKKTSYMWIHRWIGSAVFLINPVSPHYRNASYYNSGVERCSKNWPECVSLLEKGI